MSMKNALPALYIAASVVMILLSALPMEVTAVRVSAANASRDSCGTHCTVDFQCSGVCSSCSGRVCGEPLTCANAVCADGSGCTFDNSCTYCNSEYNPPRCTAVPSSKLCQNNNNCTTNDDCSGVDGGECPLCNYQYYPPICTTDVGFCGKRCDGHLRSDECWKTDCPNCRVEGPNGEAYCRGY